MATIAFFWGLYLVRYILLLFLLAIVIALFLSFFVNILQKKLKINRIIGTLITAVIVGSALSGIALLGVPPFLQQGNDLIKNIPSILASMDRTFTRLAWQYNLTEAPSVSKLFNSLFTQMDKVLYPGLSFLFKGFTGLINILAVIVVSIYLTISPVRHKMGLVKLFPPHHRDRAEQIVDTIVHKLELWLGGQLISMTAVGTMYTIGFHIAGIRYPFFLGIMAGLFSFIPFIGSIMGGLVPALMTLTYAPYKVLWIFIIYAITQSSESYFITPMVMKERVKLPPVITLMSIVIMGALFGLLGILLALPILVVSITLLDELYLKPIEHKSDVNS